MVGARERRKAEADGADAGGEGWQEVACRQETAIHVENLSASRFRRRKRARSGVAGASAERMRVFDMFRNSFLAAVALVAGIFLFTAPICAAGKRKTADKPDRSLGMVEKVL